MEHTGVHCFGAANFLNLISNNIPKRCVVRSYRVEKANQPRPCRSAAKVLRRTEICIPSSVKCWAKSRDQQMIQRHTKANHGRRSCVLFGLVLPGALILSVLSQYLHGYRFYNICMTQRRKCYKNSKKEVIKDACIGRSGSSWDMVIIIVLPK